MYASWTGLPFAVLPVHRFTPRIRCCVAPSWLVPFYAITFFLVLCVRTLLPVALFWLGYQLCTRLSLRLYAHRAAHTHCRLVHLRLCLCVHYVCTHTVPAQILQFAYGLRIFTAPFFSTVGRVPHTGPHLRTHFVRVPPPRTFYWFTPLPHVAGSPASRAVLVLLRMRLRRFAPHHLVLYRLWDIFLGQTLPYYAFCLVGPHRCCRVLFVLFTHCLYAFRTLRLATCLFGYIILPHTLCILLTLPG